MKKKNATMHLLSATEGLLSTTTNLVLFLSFLPVALAGKHSAYDINRGFEEAQNLLDEINYKTLKRALSYLVAQGLMKRTNTRRTSLDVAITKLGKERIHGLLSVYREDRPWDGHIYLLSYDIPTIANKKRDLLREYLRRIGAVILQESLWLTPYNPRDIVDDFVNKQGIGGSILVSKLGTDGAIGKEKLEDLIRRVYRLDALNERYETFLQTYGNGRKNLVKFQISLAYYAILKDDPQLPFPLLPRDFLGAKAYILYCSLMEK